MNAENEAYSYRTSFSDSTAVTENMSYNDYFSEKFVYVWEKIYYPSTDMRPRYYDNVTIRKKERKIMAIDAWWLIEVLGKVRGIIGLS